MSNTKEARDVVQLKLDVPRHIKDKLQDASNKTGLSMTLIMTMLVQYYLHAPLDIEHDVRRMLVELVETKKKQLRLSPRQKKVIADVAEQTFTAELI